MNLFAVKHGKKNCEKIGTLPDSATNILFVILFQELFLFIVLGFWAVLRMAQTVKIVYENLFIPRSNPLCILVCLRRTQDDDEVASPYSSD